ncbi:MAG: ubiquinone/menaquinone biosynthesis methyltransferase [Oligoflexia bacterium]|nr:ubiquinone/menaquinone biosynthesis methyltransferase [Oligoflexia bacterium]
MKENKNEKKNESNNDKSEVIKQVKFDHYFKANSWPEYNRQFFDQLAPKYDQANLLHSFGGKARMDLTAVKRLPSLPSAMSTNAKILDLCTGSGDLAILLAKRYPNAEIVGLDASSKMLAVAKEKLQRLQIKNVSLLYGDAMRLPFPDHSFEGVFISFGLRNLLDPLLGLQEMIRVVKRGGFISNIDLGRPQHFPWTFLHKLYFLNIAPLLGKMLFHRKEYNSFYYLAKSSKFFMDQRELVTTLKALGLQSVVNYDYYWGAAAQQIAIRPIP